MKLLFIYTACQDVLALGNKLQYLHNITEREQYPEVAQEVANNQDFKEMLNLDHSVEDSGVASGRLSIFSSLRKSRKTMPEKETNA